MTISIIGTGNVAYHLGKRIIEKGFTVKQVIGRNSEKVAWLAQQLQTEGCIEWEQISAHSDLYIIAVSDDAIPSVSRKLSLTLQDKLVVHTSGSITSTALQPFFNHFGTFYPLQTFSLKSQPDFENLPIFINANSKESLEQLRLLGQSITSKIYELSDDKRIVLHIAAVFVNNFTNHLFKIGQDILKKEQIPFDVLKPLIHETIRKIEYHTPESMQTGPAKRRDISTIEKHLAYLHDNTRQSFQNDDQNSHNTELYYEIYQLLTKSIIEN